MISIRKFSSSLAARSALVAFLALGTLVANAASAQESSVISLGVGTQKVFPAPGVIRVSLGVEAIATVTVVNGNSLLITGVSEGKTTLTLFRASGKQTVYSVVVRKQDPTEVMGDIKKLLGDIEGVSVRIVGDRIYLDGQAYTQADAERIEQISQLYPMVKSLVKIATNAKKLVQQNLNANFQKAGLKNVQANLVGNTIFLEGSVESQQDLQKAELITKAIGEKVENLLVVGLKRMVMFEVQFVELRRDSRDRYGIKYPTDITGTISAAALVTKDLFPGHSSVGTSAGSGSGGSAWAVGFQANDGYGRLLAQPTLVCASGEKAEFLAGGEIPIPLITNNQFTVEFKPYGIIMKLRPTADRNGNIQTEIEAEASEIDASVSVAIGPNVSVPGFRTRKVKTSVTVRHGETIVLSGVFSNDEQKNVSKLPGLGNIPIIGEIFKNRGFDTTRRDLLIFVTPRIVNPDSDRVRQKIDDIRSSYKQARSEVLFNVFD